MATNFVILAPMEEQDMPLELTRDHLLAAANQYIPVAEKAKELLSQADDSLLSGSAGTVYLKKMGHRPLSGEDSEKLIQTLGSKEDQAALKLFNQAQQALSQRLQRTKGIGAIMEQAGIPYMQLRRRIAKPDLWKPEQMTEVIEVLKKLDL